MDNLLLVSSPESPLVEPRPNYMAYSPCPWCSVMIREDEWTDHLHDCCKEHYHDGE